MSTNRAAVCLTTAALQVKAAGPDDGLAEGEFIAYASVFGNVDSYGDVVDDTFFDRTLEEWKASGDTIPVLWGHDVFDPFNNIGGLKEATVIKTAAGKADGEKPGLKVHGVLDIAENPTAAQVYRLMKGRRTTKMSFAYSVRDSKQEDDGNHLKDGDLFEVSVVQIPANQEAEVLAVKSAAITLLKSGRVLSSKNETALREARDAIDSVLKALDSTDDSGDSGDGKDGQPGAEASGESEAKSGASSQERVPDEEPKSAPSVDAEAILWDTYASAYAVEGKAS